MIFGKDIIAWGIEPDGQDYQVREVHLLKDGSLLRGPWTFESRWRRKQRQMWTPYPAELRQPLDVILKEAQ